MKDVITNLDIRLYELSDYYPVKTLYELAGIYNPITDTQEGLRIKLEIEPETIFVAEDEKSIIGCISFTKTSDAFLIDKLAPLRLDAGIIRMVLLSTVEKIAMKNDYGEVLLYLPEIHNIHINELRSGKYVKRNKNMWVKLF